MGFFDKLFGKDKATEVKSHQLPSDMVCKEFGEVDVRKLPDKTEVWFTILMEPQGDEAEGWQTGVALDASGSMSSVFGRALLPGSKGDVPQSLINEYLRKGWLQKEKGKQNSLIPTRECEDDLVERGYRVFSKNEIEPLAQSITAYLASNLDADGGTTVIYWACGNGKQIEVIGDLTEEDCKTASFAGPSKTNFGVGTYLMPAMRYFVDRFKDAKRGMYIFITDGRLDDLNEVKRYTKELAKRIAAGERNPVKCVLIGVGDKIDEDQMGELDDLETDTDVDIWDHKIANEMRALVEIFAEVVSETQIVAPTATIYDDSGNVVQRFTDGLPAKVAFSMPASSKAFELEVGNRRLRQTVESRKS
ncbi:MAG: hypothetical protein DDT32_00606 [Syntrophomonadaceae bacterium]|nr:hypothetical protein [Bacillota bacterium]MBT9146859.1 hypothetical protein [Bacillota bacterium]